MEEFGLSDYESLEFVNFFWSTRPNFYDKARCKNEGFDKFFPKKGQSKTAKIAIEICKGCASRFECLRYSMDKKIEYGIWGGSTPQQREQWFLSKISVEEIWKNLK